MNSPYKLLLAFALLLLFCCLVFGIISFITFFAPNALADVIPFQQTRPFHVSAALFWIITAAATGILFYTADLRQGASAKAKWMPAFSILWIVTICAIFISYAFRKFGGREYWEFPPFLNLFLLMGWVMVMIDFFGKTTLRGKQPVYIWMWTTGMLFFLFTFIEQNLWHIPWFRNNFIREMTVQWKSNGSMVGAWNQMVYGTAIYLMVKISGNEQIAFSRTAFASYFLGLTNLIFNWGHHIYNVPTVPWIRDVSYAISMTEWVLVISIIYSFNKKLEERQKFRHLITYRFLIASEFWIFLNLLLALLMSIPAINRYTHGTHITVAHAMGTTIGINSMILLSSISYMIKLDEAADDKKNNLFNICYWSIQASMFVFWFSLIAAGLLKGLKIASSAPVSFSETMSTVYPALKVTLYSGLVLAAALSTITLILLRRLKQMGRMQ